jgi:hypothetical protein
MASAPCMSRPQSGEACAIAGSPDSSRTIGVRATRRRGAGRGSQILRISASRARRCSARDKANRLVSGRHSSIELLSIGNSQSISNAASSGERLPDFSRFSPYAARSLATDCAQLDVAHENRFIRWVGWGSRSGGQELSLPRSVLTFVVFLTLSGIALPPGAPHRTSSAIPFSRSGPHRSVSGRGVSDVRGLAVC